MLMYIDNVQGFFEGPWNANVEKYILNLESSFLDGH